MIKKSDVKIGGLYIAKVTNRLVKVRIESVSRFGGWNAINTKTQKPIRVKSAQRLRSVVEAGGNNNGNGNKDQELVNGPQPTQVSSVAIGNVADAAKCALTTCPNCGGTELDEDGDCTKCHEPKIAKKTLEADEATKPHSKKIKSAKSKRPSGLDAAAKVLEETGVPMNVKEITEVAFAKGYWKPAGRTPSATLAAALIREIAKKGNKSRFCKSDRGKFVLNK